MKPACATCNTEVHAAIDRAGRILCARCQSASIFDALPAYPNAGHAMLPFAYQMIGDDDGGGGGDDDDDGKFSENPSKGKASDDDDDDGKFPDKPSKGKKRADDADRPRRRKDEPAKAGMGAGMIVAIVGVLVVCCVCLPVVGVGLTGVGGVRAAAARTQSINNAKNIVLAEHSYAGGRDFSMASPRSDKADLSWRIAMLPYIEQGPLFGKFDQTTDWDKGQNQALLSNRPMTYDCMSHAPPVEPTQTSWQYFTGPKTMFPQPTSKQKLSEINDGASNTLLFAEAAAAVPWSKAADINVPTSGAVGVPSVPFIASFADCSVRVIDPKRVDDNAMRQFIDPNDGGITPHHLLD